MLPITYNLTSGSDDVFYEELARFTDSFLAAIEAPVEEAVARFRKFVIQRKLEDVRSPHEYLIELLAIGLFFRLYAGHARQSSSLLIASLAWLYRRRKGFPRLKPAIDAVRGRLMRRLLRDDAPPASLTYDGFERLLCWLDATGDFREEVLRLVHWRAYLETLPSERVSALLGQAVVLADLFRAHAQHALGAYTASVKTFLREQHPSYKGREDFIFCGRHEAEYHFNMFAAEILNRALRGRFVEAARKAVLLPTCMSAPGHGACRAHHRGLEITCTSCTADCPINVIKLRLQQEGVATFLIPHSSSFTRFLEQWQHQPDIALVGVACVLNLLTGGYEMMKLGIASQCVFLDYCGCRRHWHPAGISTNLHVRQLLKIVSAPAARLNHE